MKQKFLSMPFYLVIAAVTFLTSCQKEGDVGPAGAQGPAGPAGPQGPSGQAGNANVIYSEWLNVDYNPVPDAVGDTIRFKARIVVPKLVDSILSKGEIKVYFNYRTPSKLDVVPLPYFNPFYYDPAAIIMPDYYPGEISLSSNYNMGTFDDEGEKRFQYRYVLIPGSVTAGRAAAGAKTIDWNNYKEVQAYLGLKD